jgi:putative membrane protein
MYSIAVALIALIALLHLYFMILEMFLWTKPQGMKAFKLTPAQAQETKTLAAQLGLYNGFLAAGLAWSVLANQGKAVTIFFLVCVLIAGLYGGLTASRKILFIQALPAAIALVLLALA